MHNFISVHVCLVYFCSGVKVVLRFNIQIKKMQVILDVASDFLRFVIRLEINDSKI